jgi:hypothetical protein
MPPGLWENPTLDVDIEGLDEPGDTILDDNLDEHVKLARTHTFWPFCHGQTSTTLPSTAITISTTMTPSLSWKTAIFERGYYTHFIPYQLQATLEFPKPSPSFNHITDGPT